MEYILRCQSGDYLGEGGTFNSVRSYAVRFSSKEEAERAAKKIPAEWTVIEHSANSYSTERT